MGISTTFIRIIFVILSLIFMIAFTLGLYHEPTPLQYAFGAVLGLGIGAILTGVDTLFKRFNLRSFNIAILGLLIGYFMSLVLLLLFDAIIEISGAEPTHYLLTAIKIFIFLFGTYLGVIMTLRASNEIYVSLPFVKFTPMTQKTKDILIDYSALGDPRLIDLAASGLVDKQLVLPRFILKELHEQEESSDESANQRAKRALGVVKKLESMTELALRYQDADFPDVKEFSDKIIRLARLLDTHILSAELNKMQASQLAQLGDIRIININALANALKPLMQRGEMMRIKIQRSGKEEGQGIGYLEDGAMVVVNGGGEHIGEMIPVHVLSVKHTASGRMIFCNVAEEVEDETTLFS